MLPYPTALAGWSIVDIGDDDDGGMVNKPCSRMGPGGLANILAFLLATAGQGVCQYVEAFFQVEQTRWAGSQEGPAEKGYQNRGRCIFGTNEWLIEDDRVKNAAITWWCTGTNIVQQTLIRKDLPAKDTGTTFTGISVPKKGERSSRRYEPSDRQPLENIEQVIWLGFCSGSFLRAEGRRIVPPIHTGENSESYSDKVLCFQDGLGLPRLVELFRQGEQVFYRYQVLESTNFFGWAVPVRFEATQYRSSKGGEMIPIWHVSGRVTDMRRAGRPELAPAPPIAETRETTEPGPSRR